MVFCELFFRIIYVMIHRYSTENIYFGPEFICGRFFRIKAMLFIIFIIVKGGKSEKIR